VAAALGGRMEGASQQLPAEPAVAERLEDERSSSSATPRSNR
jgi:hypothetical protein